MKACTFRIDALASDACSVVLYDKLVIGRGRGEGEGRGRGEGEGRGRGEREGRGRGEGEEGREKEDGGEGEGRGRGDMHACTPQSFLAAKPHSHHILLIS